jgi:hypothetical protein
MDERRLLSVDLVLDGRATTSETRYAEAGAYVLVLSSCVPELGLELHSTYVGHPEVETRVTHLILGGGGEQRAAAEAVVRPDGELPVVFARRRCLFDHLQRLQDELAGIGHRAGIEIDDASVSELEQPSSLRPL